jgi:hypothetical protein
MSVNEGVAWGRWLRAVGDPAQQPEDPFAGLVAAAHDRAKQNDGNGQRNEDGDGGQDSAERPVEVPGAASGAKNPGAADAEFRTFRQRVDREVLPVPPEPDQRGLRLPVGATVVIQALLSVAGARRRGRCLCVQVQHPANL